MQFRSASVRPGSRAPGQVRTEAIGRAQTGALSNQHQHQIGTADKWPISSPMATRPCSTSTSSAARPAGPAKPRQQQVQQGQCMTMDGQRGEAIDNRHRQIDSKSAPHAPPMLLATVRRGAAPGPDAAGRPGGPQPRCAAPATANRGRHTPVAGPPGRTDDARHRAPSRAPVGKRAVPGWPGPRRNAPARPGPW